MKKTITLDLDRYKFESKPIKRTKVKYIKFFFKAIYIKFYKKYNHYTIKEIIEKLFERTIFVRWTRMD